MRKTKFRQRLRVRELLAQCAMRAGLAAEPRTKLRISQTSFSNAENARSDA